MVSMIIREASSLSLLPEFYGRKQWDEEELNAFLNVLQNLLNSDLSNIINVLSELEYYYMHFSKKLAPYLQEEHFDRLLQIATCSELKSLALNILSELISLSPDFLFIALNQNFLNKLDMLFKQYDKPEESSEMLHLIYTTFCLLKKEDYFGTECDIDAIVTSFINSNIMEHIRRLARPQFQTSPKVFLILKQLIFENEQVLSALTQILIFVLESTQTPCLEAIDIIPDLLDKSTDNTLIEYFSSPSSISFLVNLLNTNNSDCIIISVNVFEAISCFGPEKYHIFSQTDILSILMELLNKEDENISSVIISFLHSFLISMDDYQIEISDMIIRAEIISLIDSFPFKLKVDAIRLFMQSVILFGGANPNLIAVIITESITKTIISFVATEHDILKEVLSTFKELYKLTNFNNDFYNMLCTVCVNNNIEIDEL